MPDEQVRELTAALGQAKTETQGLAREAKSLNAVFQGVLQGFGQQLTQVGFQAFNKSIASVKNTVAGSIGSFVQFEGAIRQAGAISQSLGTPAFAALVTEIERLGIATSKTPIEIANTAVSLTRAGFSAEETAEALEGIARASEATGESLELVGDIVGKTLRAFGLAADQSLEVSNILVATANATNTSVAGLGESLKFLAPTAAAANQSLGTTSVLLGILGDAGIQGSQAGTNLAAALDRLKTASAGADSEVGDLVKGNKKATEAFNLLSASVRGSDGQVRDLLEVIPEIQAGLGNLSAGDQDLVLKALFGIEGGRAFQTIANASVERIQEVTEEVKILSQQGEGAAVKTGTQLLQGIKGSLDLIGGSIDTLRNQFGEAFAPGLEGAIRLLTDIINQIIEAGDAFTAIEDAGTRFTQVLQANPQIATQLATALNDVAKIISEGIAAQLDNVTNALAANPQLVQNLANSFVEGAKKVGEFVGALSRIAGALAGIGATAGGIGGSLLSTLVPTFTALVNVLNAAVQAVQPLTNNTALLEAAFQALLIRMVAVRAVAIAGTFSQIAAGLVSLVAGSGAATASVTLLGAAQGNTARSSLLLSQSLATSAATAQASAASFQTAAASTAAVAAKFALLAGAIAAVSVAVGRFGDGGAELRKGAQQIEQQLVQTQLELKRTLDATNTTKDALTDLFPKEPPPTDFLDGITAQLIPIQERINGILDSVPGLRQALSIIPGTGIALAGLQLAPDTTNAEKRLNDQKVALDALISASDRAIESTKAFNGSQSQAATKVKNLDVAIAALNAQQQALDPGKIGTDAYGQFTQAIELNIKALEREKLEFQRRFGLVDSFSDLVEDNQQALQKIETDTQNANAKLLESGGSQRDILLAEKKGYEDRLAESRRFAAQLQNALDAGILDPEDVKKANQEILDAESAAADARKGIAQVNQDIADLVTAASEQQAASLEDLSTANTASLQQLQIDAALAKAAILESGGGQEEVAAGEKKALNDRIAANKTFLNQLKALQKGQEEGSEDAVKTAEQIKAVELTLANDRVTLAQETLKAKEEAEKKAAEAAKKAAEKAQKAAEAKAKAETDALKKQRDEEKRIADERQADAEEAAQEEFDDARDGRSEARDAQRRAEDKALQEELQADDRAFQDERRNSDRAFQKQQQTEAEAFQKSQQAAAEAFQKQLDAERDKGNREFDALGSEVDRRVQLEEADPAERRELQKQFEEERKNLELRRQIEKEVLAQRGSVLAQEDLSLSPLEQARADFEAQLQEKAKAFQEGQQLAAQAFQETQAAEAEARSEEQRLADEARADARAEADEARAEQRRLEDKAFEESERAIADAFEAQQREVKAAFNAQQRSLDESSAARIAAILEAAKPAGIDGARRDGGPVRGGGTYLVGEEGPELITPRRGGHVYTAKQTAALMAGTPVRGGAGVQVAQPSTGAVESKLDRLIAVVQAGRSVQAGGNTYNLNTDNPIQDSVSIELERIRGMVRGGGL
nr:phage tail tape measure protein [Leptolyngbya sp. FACHB-60]